MGLIISKKIKSMFLIVLLALFICSCSTNDVKDDYVNINGLNIEKIEDSLILAGQWMLNNQNENGSMKYKYLLDSKEYPDQNNMIRQFMATVALLEMYKFSEDEKYKEAFEKNLEYNLDNYYYENKDIGYIMYNNMAKLGSSAFALISLIDYQGSRYDVNKKQLENFILFMHNDTDGRFNTFYLPPDVDRNQNFYPGEAMLALMMSYDKNSNGDYLEAVKRSFDYYKEVFRQEKNPAFVPWHTMADFKLYKAAGNKEYADFIFEMNDFLVEIQHKDCGPDPYYLGRFYDPEHEEYGPPHASSTAVYVEGLTYAYTLAKDLGDDERAERYKEAILLGARSLIQLQFKDGDEKVIGGIRKTTDDNELRIDNTQHTIMAFIRILDSFDDKDISDFIDKNEKFQCII